MKFLYTNFPRQYGKVLYLKSIVFLLPKILFLKFGYLNYFGSKNQDKWVVQDIFNFKRGGYFLDLAATNGLMENNTYVLEKYFGWHGIAIEANQRFYSKLKKYMPKKFLPDKIFIIRKFKLNHAGKIDFKKL